jgi:hypothetical protein
MSSISEEAMNREIAAAEHAALEELAGMEDQTVDTDTLFNTAVGSDVLIESHLKMLQDAYEVHKPMLKVMEQHWALNILKGVKPEFALAAINVFMRTMSAEEPWTIPERIHVNDIWLAYPSLLKKTVMNQARIKLFKKWEKEAIAKAETEARAKVADDQPSCVSDMMAEVAGWMAGDALNATLKKL